MIKKSKGVTLTERLLADLCQQTFLKLWSYPNPFNENKDELCDLLVVFQNRAFIFFDRENLTLNNTDKDPIVNWKRWKKKVVDAQIRTANGAERYIKSGRGIFLDQKLKTPFPIAIDPEKIIVHKIIVAHGAAEACKQFSDDNISGSLGISYGRKEDDLPFPFCIHVDKENPVHVFDSHNLQIIFNELDTLYDFSAYLDAKIEAIGLYEPLIYCAEEDLLANYFLNFDDTKNKHFIGTKEEKVTGLMLGEGEWEAFIKREEYILKKEADKESYFWDELIQTTCEHTLNGTLLGETTPLVGKSAIHEMAKEPRFHRRTLSAHIIKGIKNFPETTEPLSHYLSFMPSFYENKAYVFLQLKETGLSKNKSEHRQKRQAMLEIACGAAKNRFDHLQTIVGIAIDAPKYAKKNSEDFILMDCSIWDETKRNYYREANEDLNFFTTGKMTMQKNNESEFPTPKRYIKKRKTKIGRNEICPCGSGKKFKKCCIGTTMI